MAKTITIPKHWEPAFDRALKRLQKSGYSAHSFPNPTRTMYSLSSVTFEMDIEDDGLLILGIWIGDELASESKP